MSHRDNSRVMGSNRSEFKARSNPIENVNWDEVKSFIGKLNKKEGTTKYRLPTEEEWEYNARAGSISKWHFGDDEGKLSNYAGYNQNVGNKTHSVAKKELNRWGLYDMLGNVWELVSSCLNFTKPKIIIL